METNQFFHGPRFIHLIRREFVNNQKNLGIIALCFFLGLLALSLSWAYDRDNEFHESIFPFFFLACGFIATSLSFKEMNKLDTKSFFLTLPASNFEKFLGRWLATGLGYILSFVIGYWLMSKVGNGLGVALFDYSHGDFDPFSGRNKLFFQLYLAIQTIFLLGAVYFRKAAIFKTFLSAVLVALGLALVSVILFRIVMYDMFDGLVHFHPEMEINGKKTAIEPSNDTIQFFKNYGESYFRLIGLWIIPAVLLVVGYFKLKETEL